MDFNNILQGQPSGSLSTRIFLSLNIDKNNVDKLYILPVLYILQTGTPPSQEQLNLTFWRDETWTPRTPVLDV